MAILKPTRESLLKFRNKKEEQNASVLDLKLARSNALFYRAGKEKENAKDKTSNAYRIGWLEGKLQYQKKHKAVLDKSSKEAAEARLMISRLHSAQKDFRALKESQLKLNRSTQTLSDQLQDGVKRVDQWEKSSDQSQERLDQILSEAEQAQKKTDDIVVSVDQVSDGLEEQCQQMDALRQHNQELLARSETTHTLAESVLSSAESQRYEMIKDHVEQKQSYENLEQRVEKTADSVQQSFLLVDESLQRIEESHQRVEESQQRVDESHQRVDESHQRVGESYEKVEGSHQQVKKSQEHVEISRQKVEESHRLVEDSYQRVEESLHQVDESLEQIDESLFQVDENRQQVDKNRQVVEESRQQVDKSRQQVDDCLRQVNKNHQQVEESHSQVQLSHDKVMALANATQEIFSETLREKREVVDFTLEAERYLESIKGVSENAGKQLAQQSIHNQGLLERTESVLQDVVDERTQVASLRESAESVIDRGEKLQDTLELQSEEQKLQFLESTKMREVVGILEAKTQNQLETTDSILQQAEEDLRKNREARESIEQFFFQAQELEEKLKFQLNEMDASHNTRWQQRYDQVELQVTEQLQSQFKIQLTEQLSREELRQKELNQQKEEYTKQIKLYQRELDNTLGYFVTEKSKIEALANSTHQNIEMTRNQQNRLDTHLEDAEWQKVQASGTRDEIERIKLSVDEQIVASNAILTKVESGLEKGSANHEIISELIEQLENEDEKVRTEISGYVKQWQEQSNLTTARQKQQYQVQIDELESLKSNLDKGFTARVNDALIEVQQELKEMRSNLDDESSVRDIAQQRLDAIEGCADNMAAESDRNKQYVVATLKQARLTAKKCNRINEQCLKLLDHVNETESNNNAVQEAMKQDISTLLNKTEVIQSEGDETKSQVSEILNRMNGQDLDILSLQESLNKQELRADSEAEKINKNKNLIDVKLLNLDAVVRLNTQVCEESKDKVDSYCDGIEKATSSFDEARTVTLASLDKTKSLHIECENLNAGVQELTNEVDQKKNEIEQIKLNAQEFLQSARDLNDVTQSQQVEYGRLITDVRGVREEAFRLSGLNQKVV